VINRVRRAAARALGGPVRQSAQHADAFQPFRSVDGPELVPDVITDPETEASAPPSLVVLIPSLELHKLTGGPNTVLNLGASVAARGVPVRFVATHGPAATSDVLSAHVGTVTGRDPAMPIAFESIAASRRLRLSPSDVVMATWWPTAHIAASTLAATRAQRFLYLVQDFEPAFYPWSTSYALALQTYAMPMEAIFNTSLLRDHVVAERIGRFATEAADDISTVFEPAVDRTTFRARPTTGPRRLLFYARPSKARNLFELGLAALRRAMREGAFDGDWEFCSIGDVVPELALPGGAVLRPIPWRSLSEYGELLGSSDVLLSLMLSPHPSYPPLEMAAGGGRVVTNVFGVKTEAALARISPAIRAVPPDVRSLAAALAEAARSPRQAQAAPMGLPGTWQEALDPVAEWIVARSFGVR
jgi:hypothetical protein